MKYILYKKLFKNGITKLELFQTKHFINIVKIIIIAFDVGRTHPNTDLSRDFMVLVVGRWIIGRTSGIPRRFLQGRVTS